MDSKLRPFKVETAVAKYTFVKLGTAAGQIVPCGAAENAIGVAQTIGAVGAHVAVCTDGETYIIAGEAIAANAVVKSNASGQASDVALAINDYALGVSMEAATAANDQIKIQFRMGVSHKDQVV